MWSALRRRLVELNAATREHFLPLLFAVMTLGLLTPESARALKDLRFFAIPGTSWQYDYGTLALTLMMLSASAQCRLRDFRALWQRPRACVVAVLCCYGAVPVVGLLSSLLALRLFDGAAGAEIALGFLLFSVIPVGVTAALWVRLAEGSRPVGFAAIALTSGLAAFTVPFYLERLSAVELTAVRVPTSELMRQLLLTVTIPLAGGVWLRSKAPQAMALLEPLTSAAGTLAFFSIFWGAVGQLEPHLAHSGHLLAAAAALACAATAAFFGAGLLGARLAGLWREDAVTIVFVSGMRNVGATVAVAMASFPDMPFVTLPAALFSVTVKVMGGLITRSVLQRDGGVLGPPIGADHEALEQRLLRDFDGGGSRRPLLALIVLRLSCEQVRTADLAAALRAARAAVRSTDYVCALPPGELAILLDGDASAAHTLLHDRLMPRLRALLPQAGWTWGVAQSREFANAIHLIEAAWERMAARQPACGAVR